MSKEFDDIVKYVDCAACLADAVEADVKSKGRKISSATVLALSKFITAAAVLQPLLDTAEASRVKLN